MHGPNACPLARPPISPFTPSRPPDRPSVRPSARAGFHPFGCLIDRRSDGRSVGAGPSARVGCARRGSVESTGACTRCLGGWSRVGGRPSEIPSGGRQGAVCVECIYEWSYTSTVVGRHRKPMHCNQSVWPLRSALSSSSSSPSDRSQNQPSSASSDGGAKISRSPKCHAASVCNLVFSAVGCLGVAMETRRLDR